MLLGYARVLDDGDVWRIGRVVLRPDARGRGLADHLMTAALEVSQGRDRGAGRPVPAGRSWYAAFGFEVDGPEFLEDGIPHLPMRLRRRLNDARPRRRPRRVACPRATSSSRWALVSMLASAALKTSRSASRWACRVQGSSRGDLERRCGAPPTSASRRQREPHLVEGEQLVDPGVRGRRDRAVGGQQPQVGQAADLGQRAHEVAQRLLDRDRLEADRRGDRGQHVVAGEEQPGGPVGEDEVALRVAGRVDGVEGAGADLDGVVAVEPGVGVAPHRQVGQLAVGELLPLLGDLRPRRPSGAPATVGSSSMLVGVVHQVEGRLVAEAEADVGAVLATDHGGQRVVVAVHVGDQEAGDVGEPEADVAQATSPAACGPPRSPSRRRPGSARARSRSRRR